MSKSLICPCCGASRSARHLELSREFLLATFCGRSVVLGPAQFEVLELMRQALPRPVYVDWLIDVRGGDLISLRPLIFRLRRKIAPIGLEILSSQVGKTAFGSVLTEGFYLLQAAPRIPESVRLSPDPAVADELPRLVCAG